VLDAPRYGVLQAVVQVHGVKDDDGMAPASSFSPEICELLTQLDSHPVSTYALKATGRRPAARKLALAILVFCAESALADVGAQLAVESPADAQWLQSVLNVSPETHKALADEVAHLSVQSLQLKGFGAKQPLPKCC
jgi:hypothetical protein